VTEYPVSPDVAGYRLAAEEPNANDVNSAAALYFQLPSRSPDEYSQLELLSELVRRPPRRCPRLCVVRLDAVLVFLFVSSSSCLLFRVSLYLYLSRPCPRPSLFCSSSRRLFFI
jgi:hypothetical protein